uniref:U-actitoxin-Avd3f-like n=1 Tax=Diabrotica virgifera virgifera TaxID=50390 RepID=A0A6P7EZD9_DIAVI
MKTTLLFFCFCIIASSQVYGDVPEIKVTHEDTVALAARPFRKGDCSLGVEQDDGPVCYASIPVFRWSDADKKCVKDIYGGCRATKNNFNTEQDCIKTATPVCSN